MVMCACAASVFAQATSSLRGKVVDAQGGALPGVSLQLVSPETSFTRGAVSDETGGYQFLQVPPGSYELTSTLEGFAVIKSKVTLQVNTPASLDLKLELAGMAESVTVAAEAVVINTVDATIGNAFNERQVRQLPLLTRNVVELLSLQPGVTPTGEVVGARRDQNNVTLDGVDVNDNQTAGVENSAGTAPTPGYNVGNTMRESGFNAALPVPLDSVQEFRVTVSGQNANQGRSSGGQVTLVTKSGTNQFRGSAYTYQRDKATSANNWFSNRSGIDREDLSRNQSGFSLGGPIVHNRLFFFGNYEQRTDRSAQSVLRRVPSETLRQGIIMARTNDGSVTALSQADLRAIDPLHVGISPAMLSIFNQMPMPNDPASGIDRGLNFAGYRFNAPMNFDAKAYVFKVDGKLDSGSRHNLSVRGTIGDSSKDDILAQYPGMDPTARLLNNSWGVSASYTGLLKPNLVNTTNFGLTRINLERTGTEGSSFTFDSIDSLVDYTRGYERVAPTYNITDDVAWTKGTHNVTFGGNLRFIRNDRTNYSNAFQRYSYNRGTLSGLGADIVGATESYLAGVTGNSGIRLSDSSSVSRAFGDVFGVITSGAMTYNYDRAGNAIPVGVAPIRNFASNEFELYFSDNWQLSPKATLTYGLRYLNMGVPFEQNGLQVAPVFPLQDFFAERIAGMDAGIPSNQLTHNIMSYDFNGPANGTASWYGRDNNNFAPRAAIAYSPEATEGFMGALFGKNGVLRAGAGIVYDRFGSDLVTQFDNAASFGLSEVVNLGPSVNFTTGPRYNGALPAIAPAQAHTFPFTPGEVNFIGGNYMGIATDLHAPWSFTINTSIQREIPGRMTVEFGYVGRWMHDQLMQIDAGGWAINFMDPNVNQTWKQMAQTIRTYHDAGVDPRAVRTNPDLVPTIPFIEDMMPAMKDLYFPGSATANYYDLIWGQNAGSDADATHQVDRIRSTRFPNCIVRTGCYTFYPTQSSGMSMWTNAGYGNFNGGTFSIRKLFTNGFSFDVNYTLSHAQDNGGGPEAGGGSAGGIMLNPFDFDAFYGDADYDIRHNLNANVLFELPFGKGKRFASDATGVTEQLVSGWQISSIFRYRSGLPTSVAYTGLWPTNFSFNTIAYATGSYDDHVTENQFGNPAIFASTTEAANWKPMLPGEVGTRAAVRLDDYFNTDIAITKSFPLPFANQRLQFRAEAFNAFNNVNFTNATIDANSPTSFGQFTAAAPPRVMQFALRYEF
jgi:hypothetical protein